MIWNGLRYRVWERPVPGSAIPPLVLIHGYAACIEQWGRFIRDIGPDVPVYAVDLIGFGEASKPRDAAYGRDLYLGQLEHLRAAYGLARAVAVGHSLGGMLAIEWAAEHRRGGHRTGDRHRARWSAFRRRIQPLAASGNAVTSDPAITRLVFGAGGAPALPGPLRTGLRGSCRDGAVYGGGDQAGVACTGRGLVVFRALPRSVILPYRRADRASCVAPLHIVWGTRDVQVSRAEIAHSDRRFPAADADRTRRWRPLHPRGTLARSHRRGAYAARRRWSPRPRARTAHGRRLTLIQYCLPCERATIDAKRGTRWKSRCLAQARRWRRSGTRRACSSPRRGASRC